MISHTNSKLLEPRWAPMFIRWKSSYSEALPKIHQHSGRIEHIIYLILLYLLYFLVSCCIPIPEASSYIPFQLISYHPKIGNINTNQSPSELSVSVESPIHQRMPKYKFHKKNQCDRNLFPTSQMEQLEKFHWIKTHAYTPETILNSHFFINILKPFLYQYP